VKGSWKKKRSCCDLLISGWGHEERSGSEDKKEERKSCPDCKDKTIQSRAKKEIATGIKKRVVPLSETNIESRKPQEKRRDLSELTIE